MLLLHEKLAEVNEQNGSADGKELSAKLHLEL
jgi:hypothetical protein